MERRRAPTLAERAQWPERLPRQATMARDDAIRDMAQLYGNAAQRARLTPQEAAWLVQERREAAHEREWGIPPWSTEPRLGPGQPIVWDGPHTGEGGWLTVAQAEAMRAKAEAAQQTEEATAQRAALWQAAVKPAPPKPKPKQAPRPAMALPQTFEQTWTCVTAYGGALVQPSFPYRCGQCGHTTTVLEPIPPGLYAAACAVCGLPQHYAVA